MFNGLIKLSLHADQGLRDFIRQGEGKSSLGLFRNDVNDELGLLKKLRDGILMPDNPKVHADVAYREGVPKDITDRINQMFGEQNKKKGLRYIQELEDYKINNPIDIRNTTDKVKEFKKYYRGSIKSNYSNPLAWASRNKMPLGVGAGVVGAAGLGYYLSRRKRQEDAPRMAI